jgi:hypothetical protein
MTKRYVFELIIEEGNDEFWESIKDTGVTEVTNCIKDALMIGGWTVDPKYGVSLNMTQYTNK